MFGKHKLTNDGTLLSALLRIDNGFASGALSPHSMGTIGSLVFDQGPSERDTFAAVWTATEAICVVRHGKGTEGACDSVPSV
jgi:hypothetical protein